MIITTYYIYADKGTLLATYSRQACNNNIVYLDEHTVYGSKRLGVRNYPGVGQNNRVTLNNVAVPNDQQLYKREIFVKHYELTDHLGNVRSVIGDTKWNEGNGIFRPAIISYTNYYPFGMAQAGRSHNSADYKFGYNGKEKDDEIKGSGNSYDYGFRMYDSRVAKFLSIDPLAAEYPWYTPFQFAGNTPIQAIDLDGLEPFFVMGTNQHLVETSHPVMRATVTAIFHKLYPEQLGMEINWGFDWSEHNGTLNNQNDRAIAAYMLADYVMENHKKFGETITLIGYSHGNNVDLQAVRLIRARLDAIGEKETKLNLIGFSSPAYNNAGHSENPLTQEKYFNQFHYFFTVPESEWIWFWGDNTIGASRLYSDADPYYQDSKGYQLRTSKIFDHPVSIKNYEKNHHGWIYEYILAAKALGLPDKTEKEVEKIWNEDVRLKKNRLEEIKGQFEEQQRTH